MARVQVAADALHPEAHASEGFVFRVNARVAPARPSLSASPIVPPLRSQTAPVAAKTMAQSSSGVHRGRQTAS